MPIWNVLFIKIFGTRTKTVGYLFFTTSPLLIVIFFTLYTIVTEGLCSFIIQDGHIIVPILVTLSLFAPVSLLASKSEKPYNKTDARAQEKLAAFIVKGI